MPKVEHPSLILRVPLPKGLCTGFPGTVCSSRCPRLLLVSIPSRNARLWNTVKTMLTLTLHPNEYSFWDHHYGMYTFMYLYLYLLLFISFC